jgi:predicted ArsR family transcriptional regulator
VRRSTERREATPAEFKAMAHPLRLRILRVCLHEPRTNKAIAGALGIDPATCLHHVRLLVDSGFLAPDDPRPGPRGSTEKPYRATGKSWTLEYPKDLATDEWLSSLDAVRAELAAGSPDDQRYMARLGLKLTEAEAAELDERLRELVEQYAARPPSPGGDEHGLYVVLHRLR